MWKYRKYRINNLLKQEFAYDIVDWEMSKESNFFQRNPDIEVVEVTISTGEKCEVRLNMKEEKILAINRDKISGNGLR